MEAFNVFDAATSAGLGVEMLKAQLLAAKLNALKFAGFEDAFLPNGQTVGQAIGDADQILDDLANGISRTKDEITAVKDLLDAANNNSHDPVLRTCPPTVRLTGGEGARTPTPTPLRDGRRALRAAGRRDRRENADATSTATPEPCREMIERTSWGTGGRGAGVTAGTSRPQRPPRRAVRSAPGQARVGAAAILGRLAHRRHIRSRLWRGSSAVRPRGWPTSGRWVRTEVGSS
jgi:hypothetical protein